MNEEISQLRTRITQLDKERRKLEAELYDLQSKCGHVHLGVAKGYLGTCPDCGEEECDGQD